MSRDVCRWIGEHPGIIPRPSSLGNFQASLETVLVTALSANALIGCRMLFICDVVRGLCCHDSVIGDELYSTARKPRGAYAATR